MIEPDPLLILAENPLEPDEVFRVKCEKLDPDFVAITITFVTESGKVRQTRQRIGEGGTIHLYHNQPVEFLAYQNGHQQK